MSTGIPAPRDDDPEEVSDKLSIAAAMWARGEMADAISWLRRAAASAADAEADDRALELAKAAADLTTAAPAPAAPAAPATAAAPSPGPRAAMGVTVPTGTKPANAPSAVPPSRPPTNAPPRPPPSRSPSSAAMPAVQPQVPATAKSIASRPAPRPSATPPPAGSGRLAPLPPLRPLGTASSLARPTGRSSSTMKATDGASEVASPPSSASMRAAQEATMPEAAHSDEIDHDQTSVMPAAKARELFQSAEVEASPMRGHAADETNEEDELRQTMRREAEERTPVPAGEAHGGPPIGAEAITGDSPTQEPARLPTLEAIRVRIYATEGGAWVVPDAPGAKGGVAAILVPHENTADLRSVFVKKRDA